MEDERRAVEAKAEEEMEAHPTPSTPNPIIFVY